MNRFNELFKHKKFIFMPFFMLGYPTMDHSFEFIKTAIDAGCDALELGIPFSDPVADGPVIEASARYALKKGANFQACCQLLSKIHAYADIPIGLLVYYNVLFQQGEDVYQQLKTAGVDAILVVDLPLEESIHHEKQLAENHIGCVQLIAPNSNEQRTKQLLDHSTVFAYVVSRYGTTGVSQGLSATLDSRIQALKKLSNCPLIVGFGMSNADQVAAVFATGAQGVIMGSQITQIIADNNVEAAKRKIFDLIRKCKQ